MYQVLARKYRPQTFGELIGQEHVKTTLENAIVQRRIAHGYIFSGQRGTGKTTVARILARCLNCIQGPTAAPDGACSSCVEIASGSAIDVIEIDAASNRGINEMRELRESVRFRPARDRYKVFIIDEAHQITSEAFNALLKTLEEPPEWVVFVLCTTEAHKIPATIQSRCQQFTFRSVDFAELVARMEWIAQQEGIAADAETLGVLAQAGEGSVRDSLSALDQAIACCGTTLNASEVRALLGMFSLDSLEQVSQALAAGDSRRMFEIVAELESNGRGLQHFARELARYFRNLLVTRIAGGPTRLVGATPSEQQRLAEANAPFSEEDLTRYLQLTLELFRDLQSSLQPRFHLEMGLLRMVHASRLQSIEEALAELGGQGPGAGAGSSRGPAVGSTGARMPLEPRSPGSPAKSSAAKPPAAASLAPAPEPAAAPLTGDDFRSRLHAALLEERLTHIADAVEHSEVAESAGEIVITTSKMYQMYLKPQDLDATVKRVAGRPVRITVKAVEPAPTSSPAVRSVPETAIAEDEVTARAMGNPEVQRFREMFPDSHIRTVRDLKDR
ncbi:MAG TPA: DNA polymerase III subunit gamma/tau [Bryobacteraceae bacterium]|nr:DNA polymerase III subunit gamma/tau [Bryobacteraceae bacterium]